MPIDVRTGLAADCAAYWKGARADAPQRLHTRDDNGTAWAEPPSDTEVRWHMTYLISDSNAEIDRRETTYHWQIVKPIQMSDELAAHDLTAQAVGDAATGMFRLVRV